MIDYLIAFDWFIDLLISLVMIACKFFTILRNHSLYIYSLLFIIDNGQTKPKPRKGKKGEPSKQPEPLGESRCLFRATNGKKKLSTIVSIAYIAIFGMN